MVPCMWRVQTATRPDTATPTSATIFGFSKDETAFDARILPWSRSEANIDHILMAQ